MGLTSPEKFFFFKLLKLKLIGFDYISELDVLKFYHCVAVPNLR